MKGSRVLSFPVFIGTILFCTLSFADIAGDFDNGLGLDEVVQNAAADPAMTPGEAVRQIMQARPELGAAEVVAAVMQGWTSCEQAEAALRAAVDLDNDSADVLVGELLDEVESACPGRGAWVNERIAADDPVAVTQTVIYSPVQCYGVYTLVGGVVSGLDEIDQYAAAGTDAERTALEAALAQKVSGIVNEANRAQAAACDCSQAILAGAAAGIDDEALRNGTWEQLGQYFQTESDQACQSASRSFVNAFAPEFIIRAHRYRTLSGPRCDDPTRCSEIDIASPN